MRAPRRSAGGDAEPIRVRFLGCGEIRMGSPYSTCRVRLTGEWVPELPGQGDDFQNLKAWSPDRRFLALVRWATGSNLPGFKVVIISLESRSVTQSRRRKGCCQSIRWEDGAFRFQAFALIDGSIKPQP